MFNRILQITWTEFAYRHKLRDDEGILNNSIIYTNTYKMIMSLILKIRF